MTGGDAVKLQAYLKSGKGLSGDVILDAVSKAVATNEVNAAMGTICATPTAGSAGVVPGTLFAVKRNFTRRKSRWSAFIYIGSVRIRRCQQCEHSGAAGGCQAEVGSASGMAAAAIVEMAGGTPEQCAEAMAIALKTYSV
ncbi:L-serine ammonia-lyase, iron-sulfur-dependent, subunit alpha [Bacillus licheniformis]|nr:L-serine ammonia-lyase, iron-sulfur-dependent, subunit alpha [Bacillus licheniformis]